MNTQEAQYPSYQDFLAFSRREDNHPSFTNLFSVHFSAPRLLQNNLGPTVGGSSSKRLDPASEDLRSTLNYYANSVNLPSKQMTTGSFLSVGSAIKYATGVAYSQMNISFIIPKSQYTRAFFEEWTTRVSSDANQYCEFYDDYVCPSLRVYKWERGKGDGVYTDPKMIRALRQSGDPFLIAKKYRITAVWEMRNVFPFNIGSIQLNNDSSRAMTLTVGFMYERYRLLVNDEFTDPGRYIIRGEGGFTDDIPQPPRYNSTLF